MAGEAGTVSAKDGSGGASVSTVKLRPAGLSSVFPASSVARTSKLWGPSERGAGGVWAAPGPEQAAKASESKRHSKLEPGSVEEKAKVGVSSEVVEPSAGPESIVVSGGVSSGGAPTEREKLRVSQAGLVPVAGPPSWFDPQTRLALAGSGLAPA